jgi:hypothetical protein
MARPPLALGHHGSIKVDVEQNAFVPRVRIGRTQIDLDID